jgi:hypothetical protein
MKKQILLIAIVLCMLSCNNQEAKEADNLKALQKELLELKKNQIDFFKDATPKYFSAKTISGQLFNSKDYMNKYLVVFIYDKSYLKKSESYDMSKEYNDIYAAYKDKVQFIGIIEGFIEKENELNEYVTSSNILFDQIDNTNSFKKDKILNYNIFCSPAKILINDNGKVIHSSCGGGNSNELIQKIEAIKIPKEK